MNYIGSKKTLLPWIDEIIHTHVTTPIQTFGDGFAGTGNVASYFQTKHSYTITASDTETYSWVVTHVRLNVPYTETIQHLIDDLNAQPDTTCIGLIARNYSPLGDRMYFTEFNARRIDTLRQAIDELTIDQDTRFFLLASLILAADKISNVSCTYGAYLKRFKASAMKPLTLVPLHTNKTLRPLHTVHQKPVCEVDWNACDVLYLDPPYNSRQYGANYFLLNYILTYEDVPLHGKTGIPSYYKSGFCQKANVRDEFHALFRTLKCKHVFLSYNDEGILSHDELRHLLSQYGRVTLHSKPYKKFKAQSSVQRACVNEYLWIIDV